MTELARSAAAVALIAATRKSPGGQDRFGTVVISPRFAYSRNLTVARYPGARRHEFPERRPITVE
jgi:hypothetical protein